MFKPSRADLAERPNSPENLARGFQGRALRSRQRFTLPDFDISDMKCVGRSEVIFYLSDKRDPNDPKGEGAQGFMKRFYHTQKPLSYLYVSTPVEDPFVEELVQMCRETGMSRKASGKGLKPVGPAPDTIVDLAELEHIDLKVGSQEVELYFRGFRLYVWDDMKTLMAWNPDDPYNNVYIWASHHTHVNWRGIID